VRPAFADASRQRGVERFGLDPQLKTLLVTGASLGARTINDAVIALLPELHAMADWQVLLLSGAADFDRVAAATGCADSRRCRVVAYTEHMPDALAAADLVIARAGASTLAELTAIGAAAILMPYPFHRDQHQCANARVLADAGAALLVEDQKDATANAAALRIAMLPLMRDAAARHSLQTAARRLGTCDAAARIARKIVEQVRASPRAETVAAPECCVANG
jgi:UDP-N-acetylglucosamine--N-acetylmuramyl-(pentapeptide) pyrophosphoryl-undecaprenol N-acetylglucosamine transferase